MSDSPRIFSSPRPGPRIGRSALSAGVANTIGRATGLLRDIVFTAIFGAGMTADAFFAAFRVPSLFRELLAEGTLANVFVPLFAETEERQGLADAWALANAVLGALLLILGVVTLSFLLLAKPYIYLVAAGFGDTPDKLALATWLTRLLSPFLVCVEEDLGITCRSKSMAQRFELTA